MGRTAMLRTACVTAALAAALGGCTSPPQEQKAPEVAAAPAPKPAAAPAPVAAAPSAAPAAVAPKPAPKPRAPAKKRPPKPKPAPVVAPAPPPPPAPPQPSPEEERKRKVDAYIAAIGRSGITFNPPSPVQVGQSVAVALAVSPPAETAQLAEDLRKSLDPGAAAWTPRMRARLSGSDFAITPEGKDADPKDVAARIDWRWTAVPGVPGSKKLIAALSYDLPQGLGGARDLPPLQRDVVVDATLSWRAQQLWAECWMWIVAVIVVAAAIGLWAWRR